MTVPAATPFFRFSVAALAVLLVGAGGADTHQDAVEGATARTLLQRSFENLYSADAIQRVRLSTGFKSGRALTYEVEILRKQSANPPKSLFRIVDPPDVRGTAVLVIEQADRGDDVFVYLPAFRVVRRVAQFQKREAFLGTDISYEDLEAKAAEHYDVRSLGSVTSGEGRCVKIETRVREGHESSYDRTVSCIEPARAVSLWTEFYRDDRVVKRLEVSQESIREIEGRYIPHQATMRTSKMGTRTVVSVTSYEMRNLPDRLFSLASLEHRSPELELGGAHSSER